MSVALTSPTTMEIREDSAVRATGLGKTIDDRHILSDIDLTLPRGGFLALLGPNGAGKTTLLRILATLTPPTSGTLHLLGAAPGRDTRAIRAKLGLIGHAPMLYRDLTLMENLLIFARLYGVKQGRERAEELLDYVDLSDRAGDAIKTFSRGMVQRAAIARALMHDPELILADEPFSGLDAPSRESIHQFLSRLNSEGRTIILSNHDIAQSLAIARNTVVLRAGRVVLNAPSRELSPELVLREVSTQ